MILLTEVTSFSGSPPSMLNNSLVPRLSPQKMGREPGDEANPNSPSPIFRGESGHLITQDKMLRSRLNLHYV